MRVTIPVEAFLAGYPPEIGEVAERLRAVVRRAVPDTIERVRLGWQLIAFDVPVGRRGVYFAWVAVEPIHVHLGFAWGIAMEDPERRLEGAHLRLKRVRYTTFRPGDDLPIDALLTLTHEAVRVATLPRDERTIAVIQRLGGR